MKRIVMLTLLLLCGMTVFASPFGLEMGWTYDEIIDSGVKVIFGDTNFLCIEPINPHPTFDTYFLSIDDKYGLYSIHALGSLLFCTSGMVISEYNDLKEQLSTSYGEPEWGDDIDFPKDESENTMFFDYVDKIENEGKSLYSSWYSDKEKMSITLSVYKSMDDGSLNYSLNYISDNYDAVIASQKAREAEVL